MENTIIRPTNAEINLNNLVHNYQIVSKKLKSTKNILAVVKANGYGHGAYECASKLEDFDNIAMFGVATVEEGIELREKAIKKPILILGSIYPFDSFDYLLKYDLTPTISSLYLAEELSKFCSQKNKQINVHIKIDTGMGRIGLLFAHAEEIVRKICSLENINVDGVYTHIANAGTDRRFTEKQISDFRGLKNRLSDLDIKYFHLANTETFFQYDDSEFDMIRIGLALYGLYKNNQYDFRQVLTLKSKIVFLKSVPENTPISYGSTFITYKKTMVATIPIGYADGYKRAFSNLITAEIKGQKVQQIGTICMDMCMFDVSNISGVDVGDDIYLSNDKNTISDLANLAGTISYELVTQITSRVPRIYI